MFVLVSYSLHVACGSQSDCTERYLNHTNWATVSSVARRDHFTVEEIATRKRVMNIDIFRRINQSIQALESDRNELA